MSSNFAEHIEGPFAELLRTNGFSPAWGVCTWAITPDQIYSVEIVGTVLGRFAEAYSDLGTGALMC